MDLGVDAVDALAFAFGMMAVMGGCAVYMVGHWGVYQDVVVGLLGMVVQDQGLEVVGDDIEVLGEVVEQCLVSVVSGRLDALGRPGSPLVDFVDIGVLGDHLEMAVEDCHVFPVESSPQ